MAHVFDDAVLETTTTTGTGALALSAVTGYKRFSGAIDVFRAAAIAVNDTVCYAAWAVDSNGARTGEWESGVGTYSAANTLTRTTVLRSSNSNAAVSFSAGTKYVALTAIAGRLPQLDNAGAVVLPAATAEPSTPAAGLMALYAREVVPGWTGLKVKRPSGVDSLVQDDISFNGLRKWVGNGTVMVPIGAAVLTVSAAGTAVTPASGTAASQVPRILYATAATAAALHTVISPSDSNAHVLRGNVQGQGGFRYVQRFNLAALQAGQRGFWGLAASRTAATNVDPLTVAAPARVGLAHNANTGNWSLVRSDGTTAAAIDLGANFPIDITSLMELVLFCRPHNGTTAGDITYRVRRYTTNADAPAFEATGTLSSNIPAATTLMHPWWFLTNNATAAVASWHFNTASIQSDW